MTLQRSIAAVACAPAAAAAAAQDTRRFVEMPAAARGNLRRQMADDHAALHEIVSLTGAGRVAEAGEVAEKRLGLSAMGKNRDLPLDTRPGAHMPQGMRDIRTSVHEAASAFAAAAGGDATKALAARPDMLSNCKRPATSRTGSADARDERRERAFVRALRVRGGIGGRLDACTAEGS